MAVANYLLKSKVSVSDVPINYWTTSYQSALFPIDITLILNFEQVLEQVLEGTTLSDQRHEMFGKYGVHLETHLGRIGGGGSQRPGECQSAHAAV